jgi:hypothetical protein
VPCGPVQTVDVVARHPHTLHRGLVVEMGEYRGTASPIKLSRTPASYRCAPPALGADTREVLDALGIDEETQQRLFDAGVLRAGQGDAAKSSGVKPAAATSEAAPVAANPTEPEVLKA